MAHLEEQAHVSVVDADAVSRRNPQSANLNTRQTINANRINCLLSGIGSAEWLFHIDGDERLDIDRSASSRSVRTSRRPYCCPKSRSLIPGG